jgi:hypothetical protein
MYDRTVEDHAGKKLGLKDLKVQVFYNEKQGQEDGECKIVVSNQGGGI